MGRTLTPEQKAESAAEELRTLIRQAHEAAQQLEDKRKEVEQTAAAASELIYNLLYENIQPAIDKYTSEMGALLTRWSERAINHMLDGIHEQCEVWDQDIRRQYVLPPANLVMDLRGKVPLIMAGDSEEGSKTLAEAEYAVVVNPK